jgi:hypothetical protein
MSLLRRKAGNDQPGDLVNGRRGAALAVIILILSFPAAYGEDKDEASVSKWIGVHAGIGSFPDFSYAVSADANVRVGHQTMTLQALYSREFNALLFVPSGRYPREEAFSVGMLYGRSYSFTLDRMLFPFFPVALFIRHETSYSVSGMAGVSLLSTTLRGPLLRRAGGVEDNDTYESIKSLSIGVPLQVEIVQELSPSVGYVHRAYCILNGKRVLWGLLIGFNVTI